MLSKEAMLSKEERNRKIIELRGRGLTLAEIAVHTSLTRERIRQILTKEDALHMAIICPVCKQPFVTRHKSIFCSDKCCRKLYEGRLKRYSFKCINCGNLFVTTKRNQKNCSPQCSYFSRIKKIKAWHELHNTPEKKERQRAYGRFAYQRSKLGVYKEQKICPVCNTQFLSTKRNERYCSFRCKGLGISYRRKEKLQKLSDYAL